MDNTQSLLKIRRHCACGNVEHALWIDVETKILELFCVCHVDASNAFFGRPQGKKLNEKILILFAGEALECLTAGLVQALLHRVGQPNQDMYKLGTAANKLSRFSLVFDLQVHVMIYHAPNHSRS